MGPWAALSQGGRGADRLHCPQSVVEGLLSPEEDCSLLLSQFREYLEHDDIRYHTMRAATDTVHRVADGHPEVSQRGPGPGRAWAAGVRGPGAQVRPPQVPVTFWNNAFTLLSAVSLPRQESGLSSFYVKPAGEERPREGRRVGGASRSSLTSHASPFLAELSDRWKVTHLKVRRSGGTGGLPPGVDSP